MSKKISLYIHIIPAFLILLSGISCTREEQVDNGVILTLSSGLPQTRGTAEIQDGMEIYFDGSTPDLVLWMFDSNGHLVAKYPGSEYSEVLNTPAPTAVDLQIRISRRLDDGKKFSAGTYSLYVMANTGGFWHLSGDPVIGNITEKADADALFFDERPTSLIADRMPLTAIGTVDVNDSGNGVAEVNLLRPVGKVVVRFVNNYGKTLTLSPFSLTLRNMSASNGYLFPHATKDIPDGVSYEDLTKTVSSSETLTLPDYRAQGEVYEYESLVYPGVAGNLSAGDFTCDLSFTITQVGTTPLATPQDFDFAKLSILNKRGEDVTSIARNQQLTITVNISQGKMLSFSFEVGDWGRNTELVTFD